PGVPRGYGEAQDVGQRAGVVVGEVATDPEEVGREHYLWRDHLEQWCQSPGVLRTRLATDQVAVDRPPGEPDPDPDPRSGDLVQLGRDGILKGPVQVRQVTVHDDLGHRVVGQGIVGGPPRDR